MVNGLLIKRFVEKRKGHARIVCAPSCVSVLVDREGGEIGRFEKALTGESQEDFSLEFDGQPYEPHHVVHMGFSRVLPDNKTVPEFLASLGMDETEVRSALDFFDLAKSSYLYCTQISETAVRLLELTYALRSNARAFVIRDPFQPFNGRWREHFAKELLDDASKNSRILICTNVSFIPKLWEQCRDVQTIDVGRIVQQATLKVQRALELEEEATKKKVVAPEAAPQQTASAARDLGALQAMPEPPPAIEDLTFGYKNTRDFIFRPLAEISQFLRHHWLAGSSFALCGSIACMMLIMVPNLRDKQLALRALKFDISWHDIKSAVKEGFTSKPKEEAPIPPVEVAPEEAQEALPESEIEPEILPVALEESLPLEEPQLDLIADQPSVAELDLGDTSTALALQLVVENRNPEEVMCVFGEGPWSE